MRSRSLLLILSILVIALAAGCAAVNPPATPPPPTKTPKPTFTVTPDFSPTPVVFATPTPAQATPIPQEVTVIEATVTPEPTQEPPSPTPAPAARLTAGQNVNVRQGPGTNYSTIGSLRAGQSFEITGKNAAGDWWQITFNGQPGWVIANLVSASGDTDAVPVAQNIPQPPPTARPVARPQPTAAPPPAAPPAAPPQPRYEYNVALVQKCERQPAGNWFDGTVYRGGQPVNGVRVVFSYAPDGPWASSPQISGPHEGYPGWNAGYYSHIIHASGPEAGDWYVWLVNEGGARISEIAHWRSTGPGDGCNQATVDFDSR